MFNKTTTERTKNLTYGHICKNNVKESKSEPPSFFIVTRGNNEKGYRNLY